MPNRIGVLVIDGFHFRRLENSTIGISINLMFKIFTMTVYNLERFHGSELKLIEAVSVEYLKNLYVTRYKDALLALGARALFLFHGTLAVWKCQSTYNTAFMYILLGIVLITSYTDS